MTDSARAELRRRIAARLSGDEWMNRHFGISCHAHDVADAVLEVLDDMASTSPTACGCPVDVRPVRIESHTHECSRRQAAERHAAHLADDVEVLP